MQVVDELGFLAGVATSTDQNQIVASLGGFRVDGGDEVGVERVGNAGNDHRQRAGAVGRETAGQSIRPEVKLGNGRINTCGSPFGNVGDTVEVLRDGRL